MDVKIGDMDDIKKLLEKRDEYRQDIDRHTRQNAFNDDVMVEVDKVLLADIEWQLDNM